MSKVPMDTDKRGDDVATMVEPVDLPATISSTEPHADENTLHASAIDQQRNQQQVVIPQNQQQMVHQQQNVQDPQTNLQRQFDLNAEMHAQSTSSTLVFPSSSAYDFGDLSSSGILSIEIGRSGGGSNSNRAINGNLSAIAHNHHRGHREPTVRRRRHELIRRLIASIPTSDLSDMSELDSDHNPVTPESVDDIYRQLDFLVFRQRCLVSLGLQQNYEKKRRTSTATKKIDNGCGPQSLDYLANRQKNSLAAMRSRFAASDRKFIHDIICVKYLTIKVREIKAIRRRLLQVAEE